MSLQKNQILPSIPEFYAGQSILVTGSTGFLGKVIVEKLLRSCSDIDKIYLLIRPKKGKNVNSRLTELTNSPAFDLVRAENPSVFDKIVMIEGDISQMELGLSKSDQKLLCENVTVILNAAASVNLNDRLKNAVFTDLRSVRELLTLAHEIKNLKSLIHCSTTYIALVHPYTREEIYPAGPDPNEIIDLCEKNSDDVLKKLTPKLLGKFANTYLFSKCLAENLIMEQRKDLPLAIVRPSIISSSIAEPCPGWMDAYTSATPFMDGISRGIFRSFYSSKGNIGDFIPVDIVSNAMIAAGWNVGVDPPGSQKSLRIFNSVSGDTNPITFEDYFKIGGSFAEKYPSESTLRYPNIRVNYSKIGDVMDKIFCQYIPAYVLDFKRIIQGRKPNVVKRLAAIDYHQKTVEFLLVGRYAFESKNTDKLFNSLNTNDQKEFNFNPRSYNWNKYLEDYYLGMKKFITPEANFNSSAAHKKLARLRFTKFATMASSAAVGLWFIGKMGN